MKRTVDCNKGVFFNIGKQDKIIHLPCITISRDLSSTVRHPKYTVLYYLIIVKYVTVNLVATNTFLLIANKYVHVSRTNIYCKSYLNPEGRENWDFY